MANMIFNKVRTFAPKSNKFDLSHQKKFSCKDGFLIPVLCQEILPGDRWKADTEVFIRLAPMVSPIMQNMSVTIHNFYVPVRIIWDESEPYFTGGESGLDAPVHPYININETLASIVDIAPSSLLDYMGFPVVSNGDAIDNTVDISALPFRAYCQIWNDYYRDQNVQSEFEFPKTSGLVSQTTAQGLLQLRRRAWEKDYFTSALPSAQRGAAVNIPISDAEAEIEYMAQSELYDIDGVPAGLSGPSLGSSVTGKLIVPNSGGVLTSGRLENIAGINITGIAATINDLRTAIRTQSWLEKMMLSGARYVEQLKIMWGVRPSDARMQRAEYLGGGTNPVVISEVLSTVENTDLPQGNMAGHGIAVGRGNGYSRFFEEHGFVMTIMSIKPKTSYQQGIPKMFLRKDKFDHYWMDFAHLGEQAVQNQELYWDPQNDPALNTATFGYQSRYCEYKQIPDSVAGEFRTTLSHWHQGRIFDSRPALNADFVQANPSGRIWAVPGDNDTDHFYCMIHHRISALRPIPYFSTPQL